jgi:hypothetical protein
VPKDNAKSHEFVGLSKAKLKMDLIGFTRFNAKAKGLAADQMHSEQDIFNKN